MAMHESGEMYLETIYVLSQQSEEVRAIDVSKEMGFSKPSVSRAMSILRDSGLITIDERGRIELSDAGRTKAKQIYERHLVLTELLTGLGVSEQTAADDACRIEHYISDETFTAIKSYMAKQGFTLPTTPV